MTAFDAQAALIDIWCEVLDLDVVGPDDDFYVIGGDSILAIQAVAIARERGLSISVRQLLEAGTIRVLADGLIADARSTEPEYQPLSQLSGDDRSRLGPDVVDAYPMTALQLGMLFHSEGSAPDSYHSVSSVVVRRPMDGERLLHCLTILSDRHAALRSSFDIEHFSVPLILVHRTAKPPLSVFGLTTEPIGDRRERVLAEEQAVKLDWHDVPVIRWRADALTADSFLLTCSVHHVLLDGWSNWALLTELVERYSTEAEADIDPPPPFGEYVAAERAAREDPATTRFWSGYLDGAPSGRIPSPVEPPAGGEPTTVAVPIPTDVTDGLLRIAHDRGVPVKTLYRAAHAVALGRLEPDADEVLIGLVVHSRPERTGGDAAAGLYLNTVPLRIPLTGSWEMTANAVAAAEKAVYPYRGLATADIQAATGVEIENICTFADYHGIDDLVRRGLVEQGSATNEVYTSVPLLVEVAADAGTTDQRLLFQFHPDRWPAAGAQRFVADFLAILASMVTGFDEPAVHRPDPAPATPKTLVDMLRRARADHPDRPAIATPESTFTYRELDHRIGILAATLRAAGIGPEARVGVLLPRTADLVVAIHAVLEAGAAVVPLDPGHPAARNARILTAAGVDLLLGTPAGLPGFAGTVVDVSATNWAGTAPPTPRTDGPAPDQLAYVLYTSGSTGAPKGVALEHAQLVNLVRGLVDRVGLTAEAVVLAWSTVVFDMGFAELVLPLTLGARIELVGDVEARDPVRVRDRIRRTAVTVVEATPTKLRLLTEVGWTGPALVLSGGEVLPQSLVRELTDGGCQVWNGYGPTETAVYTTLHRCDPDGAGPIPIGRPLPGYTVEVRDAAGHVVPAGTQGEIWIGGACVARGYLGAPELTAERFVVDASDGRYYRTGDRGRYRQDGELEFHGRADSQVKLHGVRVELEEVEQALSAHPSVRQAVVTVANDPEGSRLTAHVAADEVTLGELRRHLAERLPEVMVPTRIVIWNELPTGATGKVDRRLLTTGTPQTPAGSAPATPWERIVADLWGAVLGIATVGRTDDFADLGGDSLHLMRLIGAFAQRGHPVTVIELRTHRTVADQARLLASRVPGRG
ncbi:amino acid adenylation domain-containing protein [Actinoplanes sp. NBRC 101535]|uniref:non-ribosomal peptide synthetase n=1 Tax=Actinoplanes sp. NBRC 101535 TaxID=3032196 RepID=UPI0024A32B5C|nr:amino acid adenylation domain-containing protein [Actinoplanes sp. NBRC 101535]GLY02716.1 hypothetical protein Acsp01_30950 [Actinoplanes sp. NBRC 101535]